MNVNDVADDSIPIPTTLDGDRLGLIFARQTSLIEKYHPIEERNGLLLHAGVPVPLHDKHGQARLKDFAWRVTEEITEATLAQKDGDRVHYIEEISDAFHFLVELLILSDLDVPQLHAAVKEGYPYLSLVEDVRDRLDLHMQMAVVAEHGNFPTCYEVIECLGEAMNCLKCKPWKQTHMITDVGAYKRAMVKAWLKFLAWCSCSVTLTYDELYRIYYKKSEVNRFRQRSMY